MRILREDTAAILVDIQERLIPAIHGHEEVVALSTRLVKGLRILGVPVVAVQQYPKGLGLYPPELSEALGACTPLEKATFSAWDTEAIAKAIRSLGKKNAVVFGMEAHVCVLQTVIDLLGNGINAVLVADCIGSRNERDMAFALRRAEAEGARLTTSEALLFELLRTAKDEAFKQISALVK